MDHCPPSLSPLLLSQPHSVRCSHLCCVCTGGDVDEAPTREARNLQVLPRARQDRRRLLPAGRPRLARRHVVRFDGRLASLALPWKGTASTTPFRPSQPSVPAPTTRMGCTSRLRRHQANLPGLLSRFDRPTERPKRTSRRTLFYDAKHCQRTRSFSPCPLPYVLRVYSPDGLCTSFPSSIMSPRKRRTSSTDAPKSSTNCPSIMWIRSAGSGPRFVSIAVTNCWASSHISSSLPPSSSPSQSPSSSTSSSSDSASPSTSSVAGPGRAQRLTMPRASTSTPRLLGSVSTKPTASLAGSSSTSNCTARAIFLLASHRSDSSGTLSDASTTSFS
mmetsp:Transcript_16189/g.50672  ORF Transcript_16189/g.50672 Transcript_16189/m.50672 type:complete len:332 (-) Transcript_16189:1761-2756(-)